MPVAISNRTPPTTPISVSRSSAWAALRIGGQPNRRGATDHSLARTSGTSVKPSVTWMPWLAAYSHDGDVGDGQPGRGADVRQPRTVDEAPGERLAATRRTGEADTGAELGRCSVRTLEQDRPVAGEQFGDAFEQRHRVAADAGVAVEQQD